MHRSFRRVSWVVLALATMGAWPGARAADRGPEDGKPFWRRSVFERIATDQAYLFRTWLPLEIRRPGFSIPVFASTAYAVTGSFSNASDGIDARLEFAIYSNAGPAAQKAAHVFTAIGNPPVVLAVIGATYLAGHFGRDDRLAEASSLAFESFVDAGLWNVVLKEAAARVRPGEPDEAEFLKYGVPQNQSFPSGHAMGAFSVASVYAEVYRDARWVGGLAYGAATAIALSRVVLGRHFPADVIVGGVLGASFGKMVVTRSREAAGGVPHRRRWRDDLRPVSDAAGRGIGIGWSRAW